MNFLKKIINFIKNFHPIRSFAKPIPGRRHEDTYESQGSYAISYEDLTADLEQTREEAQPVISYNYQTRYASESAYYEDHEPTPGMVMNKLAVRPEVRLVYQSQAEVYDEVEEPVAGEALVGELIARTDVPMSDVIVLHGPERIAEIVEVSETVSSEPTKKTRTRKVTTPAAKKAPAKAKKTVKKAPVKRKVTRSKKEKDPVPPEAMGFGF
jgi:hypothetical protein